MKTNFWCEACGESYTEITDTDTKVVSIEGDQPLLLALCLLLTTPRSTTGAAFCFHGFHTTQPLDEDDLRRIRSDTTSLIDGPQLQQEIDALPESMPGSETLTITSGGFYDSSGRHTLCVRLPQLTVNPLFTACALGGVTLRSLSEVLHLIDVSFARITLNEALTPNLAELKLQNVPDDCDLEIELPKLREASIRWEIRIV